MAAPNGLIVAWPSTAASIPSGWSRYAALNSAVPKPASSSITTTGGSDTHTHSTASHTHSDLHVHTTTWAHPGGTNVSGGGTPVDSGFGGHTKDSNTAAALTTGTASGTSNSGTSIGFARFSVIWIQSDGTTDIPTNAVAYSNQGTVPSGWSAYANGINAFLRGADVGVDGGTTTAAVSHNHTYAHTHTNSTTAHTHSFTGSLTTSAAEQDSAGADSHAQNHSHSTITGSLSSLAGNGSTASSNATSDSTTPEPLWYKLQTIQASGAATAPLGVIALWTTTTPPASWTACNGTNGTPNINGSGNFIKGANGTGEIGNTGGASTHTHSGSHGHTHDGSGATHAHTSGSVSANAATGTFNGTTAGTNSAVPSGHTHSSPGVAAPTGTSSTDAVSYGAASHEPAYVNMFFIMALGSGRPRGILISKNEYSRIVARTGL